MGGRFSSYHSGYVMNLSAWQTQLAAAHQALKNNQLADAVTLYSHVLQETASLTLSPTLQELRLKALADCGRALADLGDIDGALAINQQYLQEANSDQHRVRALEAVGSALRRIGRFSEARDKYRESLKLADTIMYPSGRAKALEGLGTYYHLIGHDNEAKLYLEQAITLFKSAGDVAGQVTTLNWIGLIQSYNEVDKAITTYTEALTLARRLGHLNDVVILMDNLGESYLELYDIDKAVRLHREALDLAEQYKLGFVRSDLHRNLGVAMIYLGHISEAMYHLQLALALSQETNDVEIEAQVLFNLGMVELEQGNREIAQHHALTLQDLAQQNSSTRFMARAKFVLGKISQKLGENAAATTHWQEALYLAHQSQQQNLLWQIHAALAEAESITGLREVHWRIAAEIIQQIAHPIQDLSLKQKFLNAPPIARVLAQAQSI